MFEYLLQDPAIKKALGKYLCDDDYVFIKELIDPPKRLVS
jgi:hypothetical protein